MGNMIIVLIPVIGAVIITALALHTATKLDTKKRSTKKDTDDIERLIKDEIKRQLINLMK